MHREPGKRNMFRFAFLLTLLLLASGLVIRRTSSQTKPPETIVLSKEAKLGQVAFNHLRHITENRSPDGTKQIACIECHHTAQPAAEVVKHPPHKTVWPADRTTTLTAELVEKDPNAVGAVCHDCHTKTDSQPKLVATPPQIKNEAGDTVVLNNQQAF